MSGKRLLDYDSFTGVTTYFHWDDVTEMTYLQSVKDTGPGLELNKKLYNSDEYKRHGYKEGMVHAASVDVIIIEKWLREEGIDFYNPDHWPKVKQKLNSTEYRYLRTSSGRI